MHCLRAAVVTSLIVVSAAGLVGCTSEAPDPNADSVIASLGAVPIPTAPATEPVPTATPGVPQVLAMGAPTVVVFDPSTVVTATASGPDQTTTLPSGPPEDRSTDATITLTVASTAGSVTVLPTDLVCRDETGEVIPFTGGEPVTVTAGQSGSLTVTGHFTSGAAQVTWQPGGRAAAVWDFNIELD